LPDDIHILPNPSPFAMRTHQALDEHSLQLHQLIAGKLRQQPHLFEQVTATLNHWQGCADVRSPTWNTGRNWRGKDWRHALMPPPKPPSKDKPCAKHPLRGRIDAQGAVRLLAPMGRGAQACGALNWNTSSAPYRP